MEILYIVALTVLGLYLLGAIIWAITLRRKLRASNIEYSRLEFLTTIIWFAMIIAYWISLLNREN